jgi:pimeloyl-ACP methyl ester carboxylesterase
VYKHVAYALFMATRPQSMIAFSDSPVGLAALMIDHDRASYELIARVFDGRKEGLSRDDILDNITLFWLTKTGVSSARLYWENKLAFFAPKGVAIPVAVSACPTDIHTAPRSWVEKAYPNLIQYTLLPKCGHFAAWEQPEMIVGELRKAFESFR